VIVSEAVEIHQRLTNIVQFKKIVDPADLAERKKRRENRVNDDRDEAETAPERQTGRTSELNDSSKPDCGNFSSTQIMKMTIDQDT
jgi:hypothetical protein